MCATIFNLLLYCSLFDYLKCSMIWFFKIITVQMCRLMDASMCVDFLMKIANIFNSIQLFVFTMGIPHICIIEITLQHLDKYIERNQYAKDSW